MNTTEYDGKISWQHMMNWRREEKTILDADCRSMELRQSMEKLDKELVSCLNHELVEVRKTSFVSLIQDQFKLEHQEISKEDSNIIAWISTQRLEERETPDLNL